MGGGRMARLHPVEVAALYCPHDLLHVPHHGDGGRHGPLHPRLARGEEGQEVTTVVAGQDGAEEWQREQSRTRTLRTQAGGPE